MGVRITSWNVNGIRNPFGYQPWSSKKTFEAMFDILEADIVVMQETKIQRKDLQDDMVLVPGWDVFFSLPKHKKGYAGVAIYTRNSVCSPIRAEEGITGVLCPPNSSTSFRDLPEDQQIGGYPRPGQLDGPIDDTALDSEGRCVILEFPAFVLIGTYSPATRDETRDDFRLGYNTAVDVRIRNLVAMGKRVVLTGDLNVIRDELDSAHLPDRLRKEGLTMEQFFSTPVRRIFNHLVFEGTVYGPRDEDRENPVLWDLGRFFNPTRQGMFTCWETKKNHRPGNFGSRIDYVLCSEDMKDWFSDSNIQEGLMGSDHCPVFAMLKDKIQIDGEEVHTRDVINAPGIFKNGIRLRDWSPKDLLPLSAKLIPEFDRRRNIKDMFFKKPLTPKTTPATPSQESPVVQNDETTEAASSETSKETKLETTSEPLPSIPAAKPTSRALKRTPSIPVSSSKPSKKMKGTLAKETSASMKGQSNLMGFFKSTASGNSPKKTNDKSQSQPPDSLDGTFEIDGPSQSTLEPAQLEVTEDKINSMMAESEKVFDPIQAKESWSKLLGKRIVPRCEHEEECISLVTKKPGMNRGRSFFICPRPIGPTGEKEKGTQWRCGTFIWSSDWNPSNAS
ncbi:DNA lyase [Xylariaceae sp. FL0255]|nr:DNA lyase [Xylariaceae sp. FL0255]